MQLQQQMFSHDNEQVLWMFDVCALIWQNVQIVRELRRYACLTLVKMLSSLVSKITLERETNERRENIDFWQNSFSRSRTPNSLSYYR